MLLLVTTTTTTDSGALIDLTFYKNDEAYWAYGIVHMPE